MGTGFKTKGLRCKGCLGTHAQHRDVEEGCWCPRCLLQPEDSRCREWRPIETDPRKGLPDPDLPRKMNVVDSPTGRVAAPVSQTSLLAAMTTNATGHRAIILEGLRNAADVGLTSIEAARLLPLTRQGGEQVSNRSASRLGELWEAGQAAPLRENGTCVLGECAEHEKPRVVHRPSGHCAMHGPVVVRDGAAVWIALG